MTAERRLELEVRADEANQRLDKWLVQRVPELGRRKAAELFREGRVRVAGRIAKKSELCQSGQRVQVELRAPTLALPDPSLPLDVRLETKDVVVVNKPAGQPSVPVPGSESGTLASALLARYPELSGVGYSPREPGLLHRLDTGTSGLLLAARSEAVFQLLRRALRAGQLEKRYLAVVESAGLPGSGVIDFELAPDARDARRMRVARRPGERGARPALTEWRTLERGERFALVEIHVGAARRHQIRVHLAAIGHPIAGDALYGGTPAPGLEARHALHASYLAWKGDARLPAFSVEAPLPSELGALVGRTER